MTWDAIGALAEPVAAIVSFIDQQFDATAGSAD